MAEITGRHVLAVTSGAFAVIISVNLLLAYKAISTFPGLEVRNSYVASQGFNDRRAAQEDLGWTLAHAYDQSTGRLSLDFLDAAGAAAPISSLRVLVGRATVATHDQSPEMVLAAGKWQGQVFLKPGKWILKVEAFSKDAVIFEQRVDLQVKG